VGITIRGKDDSGEAEVAVQPGVPEGSAVDLDAELKAAFARVSGAGLEPKVGRVGVSADDGKPPQRAAAEAPRDDGAIAADVPVAGREIPRGRVEFEAAKPLGGEPIGDGVSGVPGRRRGVDEGAEVTGGVLRTSGARGLCVAAGVPVV
jgi:hypothetical protein